jgi:hypothetical protein
MIISRGYIDCFVKITAANYIETQSHRWDLGPSTESIDTPGIHKIPYTWRVTGGGSNSYQSWQINASSLNSNTPLYFQTLLSNTTHIITLSKYTSQFAIHHGATGAGIDSDALEVNYVPAEMQWSSMSSSPSFSGGVWRVLHLPTFSRLGRSVGGITIMLPWMPGATETTNTAPFYGNGAVYPRTITAAWYWEIDF